MLASGFPRTPTELPIAGSSSLDSLNTQTPHGVLRRTHRLVSGNRPLTAALRRARWATADRQATLRRAPKSCQGSGETESGLLSEPCTSLVSRFRAPKSSSARRRRGLLQSSVEPDAPRQGTFRLRRATGAMTICAKVSELCRSPSTGHLVAPKSTEAKVVGSLLRSHMNLMYEKYPSSSSEEPDEFSLKHGEDHEEPTHQPKTPFQAPRSLRDCHRSDLEFENLLTTNKENRGSRTTLRSPPRHAATPRGYFVPFQLTPRSRRTAWGRSCQTGGARLKPSAYQQLAPALRRAPESVAGSQTARV